MHGDLKVIREALYVLLEASREHLWGAADFLKIRYTIQNPMLTERLISLAGGICPSLIYTLANITKEINIHAYSVKSKGTKGRKFKLQD